MLDRAIFRIAKGAVGLITVEGADQPDIYNEPPEVVRIGQGIQSPACVV